MKIFEKKLEADRFLILGESMMDRIKTGLHLKCSHPAEFIYYFVRSLGRDNDGYTALLRPFN